MSIGLWTTTCGLESVTKEGCESPVKQECGNGILPIVNLFSYGGFVYPSFNVTAVNALIPPIPPKYTSAYTLWEATVVSVVSTPTLPTWLGDVSSTMLPVPNLTGGGTPTSPWYGGVVGGTSWVGVGQLYPFNGGANIGWAYLNSYSSSGSGQPVQIASDVIQNKTASPLPWFALRCQVGNPNPTSYAQLASGTVYVQYILSLVAQGYLPVNQCLGMGCDVDPTTSGNPFATMMEPPSNIGYNTPLGGDFYVVVAGITLADWVADQNANNGWFCTAYLTSPSGPLTVALGTITCAQP